MNQLVYSALGIPEPKYPLSGHTAFGQLVMIMDGETRGVKPIIVMSKEGKEKQASVYYATPTELVSAVRYSGKTSLLRGGFDIDSFLRQVLKESCIKSAAQALLHLVTTWEIRHPTTRKPKTAKQGGGVNLDSLFGAQTPRLETYLREPLGSRETKPTRTTGRSWNNI